MQSASSYSSASKDRILRARQSLEGLSTGDAFGESFFHQRGEEVHMLRSHILPASPWRFTDDTVMAISIVDTLAELGGIEQDLLSGLFAFRYRFDPMRGYGAKAHDILSQISQGVPWRQASSGAFGGTGSMGNGGAMRSAPIGAYFYDDFDRTVENARLSAEVTHFHPEGQAGAVAVAIAAACMGRSFQSPLEFFDAILEFTPESETRAKIREASELPLDSSIRHAVSTLGNGSKVISQDTVPFALWCAAGHLEDFEGAMWRTASGYGDIDTNCAITGGILTANPNTRPPEAWVAARESLDIMLLDRE